MTNMNSGINIGEVYLIVLAILNSKIAATQCHFCLDVSKYDVYILNVCSYIPMCPGIRNTIRVALRMCPCYDSELNGSVYLY
jgi:hypothetical protein